MTDQTNNCQNIQPLLREYALGLLSEKEIHAVAAHLDVCEDCRATYEAEQAALALLDSLPEEEIPVGLAERTISHVEAEAAEKERRKRSFWSGDRFAEVMVVLLIVGGTGCNSSARIIKSTRSSAPFFLPEQPQAMGSRFQNVFQRKSRRKIPAGRMCGRHLDR